MKKCVPTLLQKADSKDYSNNRPNKLSIEYRIPKTLSDLYSLVPQDAGVGEKNLLPRLDSIFRSDLQYEDSDKTYDFLLSKDYKSSFAPKEEYIIKPPREENADEEEALIKKIKCSESNSLNNYIDKTNYTRLEQSYSQQCSSSNLIHQIKYVSDLQGAPETPPDVDNLPIEPSPVPKSKMPKGIGFLQRTGKVVVGDDFQAEIPQKLSAKSDREKVKNLMRLNNFFTLTRPSLSEKVEILKHHPYYDILRRSSSNGDVYTLALERSYRKMDLVDPVKADEKFMTIFAYLNQYLAERDMRAVGLLELKIFFENNCACNLSEMIVEVMVLGDKFQKYLEILDNTTVK